MVMRSTSVQCFLLMLQTDKEPATSSEKEELCLVSTEGDEWPKEGKVEFVDYAASYKPGVLPDVLRSVSFVVQPGEKVSVLHEFLLPQPLHITVPQLINTTLSPFIPMQSDSCIGYEIFSFLNQQRGLHKITNEQFQNYSTMIYAERA